MVGGSTRQGNNDRELMRERAVLGIPIETRHTAKVQSNHPASHALRGKPERALRALLERRQATRELPGGSRTVGAASVVDVRLNLFWAWTEPSKTTMSRSPLLREPWQQRKICFKGNKQ